LVHAESDGDLLTGDELVSTVILFIGAGIENTKHFIGSCYHALLDDRDPNDHVAFGHGVHFCLGASLARLELRVMFETLLTRLPDLTLATDEPLPLRPSNFIVGIEEMPVVFTPIA